MRRRALAPRLVPAALLALVLGLLLTTGLTPVRPASPVAASTAQTMAADLITWINGARVKHGLGKLRTDARLMSLAGERAATLASLGQLSHAAAGCLTCQLAARGISYNLVGEDLASNTWPWGQQSASIVFSSWKGSPTHWAILMTARMDSIGIGVSESADGTTYASALLIDAPGIAPIKAVTPTRTVVRHAVVVRTVAAAPPTAPARIMVRWLGSVRMGRIAC